MVPPVAKHHSERQPHVDSTKLVKIVMGKLLHDGGEELTPEELRNLRRRQRVLRARINRQGHI